MCLKSVIELRSVDRVDIIVVKANNKLKIPPFSSKSALIMKEMKTFGKLYVI